MKAFLVGIALIGIVLMAVGYGLGSSGIGSRDIDSLYIFGKHDTTGLCFFGEDWNSDGSIDAGTAGYVPCTPEVEKWIADHRGTQ